MRKGYVITGAICCVLSVFFLGLSIWFQLPHTDETIQQLGPREEKPPVSTDVSVEEPTMEEKRVDFEALQRINSDIYAWLEIPDTPISYVVVQSSKNDEQYVRRDVQKKYSVSGTLFTEHRYNGTDFKDKTTIIYGHCMKTNEMFGSLQTTYSDQTSFTAHRQVKVYLPDRELHYAVFAAVPYSNRHIMKEYSAFEKEGSLKKFVSKINQTRGFGTCFDKSISVEDSDKILILSTCLQGNNQKRYLVLAKLMDEIVY